MSGGDHSHEHRLRFILEAQGHCDQVLAPIADPAGRSVLVVGAGAGTEMLWCLRHGAREVVGIDPLPQDPSALVAGIEQLGAGDAPWELLRLGIEGAATLGRTFDLVLSYNVLEHLPHLERAFAACARLIAPVRGRVAVFTDPLYYSSHGSHLPMAPWEHLWGDGRDLRRRLMGEVPGLDQVSLGEYLRHEISLNRARLDELLRAIAASGLVPLALGVVPDRRITELGDYLERLGPTAADAGVQPIDLAVEGFYAELALPGPAAPEGADAGGGEASAPAWRPTAEVREERREQHRAALQRRIAQLEDELAVEREHVEWHRRRLAEVHGVLESVEASFSFRLGRALTAPLRRLRALRRG